MKKIPAKYAAMGEELMANYNDHVAKLKADSKTKFGFVQKAGFNIPFLSPKRLAEQLDTSIKTLERLRKHGGGPPFVKIGNRRIRYPIIGLEAWCDANMQATIPAVSSSAPLPTPVTTGEEDDLQCKHNAEKEEEYEDDNEEKHEECM